MSKINGKFTIFIVFLILVVLIGLFIKVSVDSKTPAQRKEVGGFFIEFEDGTTESEVKTILEYCNMSINYTVDYNSDIMPARYYIMVDKDKIMDVRDELNKEENWTDYAFPDFQKGNYVIITVTEQAIKDKSFLEIIEKNNLQVKKSVLCLIHFIDGSKDWIPRKDALKIKDELEANEKVLVVTTDSFE